MGVTNFQPSFCLSLRTVSSFCPNNFEPSFCLSLNCPNCAPFCPDKFQPSFFLSLNCPNCAVFLSGQFSAFFLPLTSLSELCCLSVLNRRSCAPPVFRKSYKRWWAAQTDACSPTDILELVSNFVHTPFCSVCKFMHGPRQVRTLTLCLCATQRLRWSV